ncbi:transcription antitermination factor NusB [Oceanobacillus caeni]|uniref:Transcription antitermination protein NusB n=1 Tax=Oceanobacillus caeni TaxID=405946 RepID=A0ABR5ML77_9BACI|nr:MULTISPECIES: transcription antitermination factor NusB [Bacillaceae]KKE80664.1 antitermination protein NusB [Bacilli bacterium VT-13-104]PZD85310.1 transcription antitermination factor NusB [Bacilli bacterium]KPH76404.1 antitermination protein NusB [Oceanobacillus caeni]MCR1834431.1 transcription antitermination factor NusB [Oceanobacillus caeni]MED4473414.1 transcription antitermination factor NusB [Oceanobacillus caeni]
MNRHTARIKAFQILFQMDLNEMEIKAAIGSVVDNNEKDLFLESLVHGVTDHQQEIDSIISDHLEKWTLNRIASVERSILRIATFEIKFLDDIPNSVSINEAIELANKFGDEKSGKFVNAVLSKIIS